MSKVDQETALADFQRMCETADCTFDTDGLDDQETTDLQGNIDFFVGAIMAGALSVDEDGLAVVHLKDGKQLRFRAPEGKELAMVAGAPEGQQMQALVKLAAALTGSDVYRIGKLRKREWKLAVRLAGFLSGD